MVELPNLNLKDNTHKCLTTAFSQEPTMHFLRVRSNQNYIFNSFFLETVPTS